MMENNQNNVQQMRSDWILALMTKGVIVDLRISRWRGLTSLNYDDLGVKFTDQKSEDFARKYIKLGNQKLFPPDILRELGTVELLARKNLSDYSFDTIWGKFVPNTALKDWEERNKILRQDYLNQARSISEKYEEIVGMVREDYKTSARDVWKRLYPENPNGATPAFIENFVSKVVEKIPSRDEIVASFKYDVVYFVIPLPSFIEKDIASSQKIRQETEMKELKHNLDIESQKVVAEEYRRRKEELIDGFLDTTVKAMRQYVSELCDSIAMSITKHSKTNIITLKYINKIKEMVKKVKTLNFYDDKEITDALRSLENEVDKFKDKRDDNLVVKKLKEIVEMGQKQFVPNINPAIAYLEI